MSFASSMTDDSLWAMGPSAFAMAMADDTASAQAESEFCADRVCTRLSLWHGFHKCGTASICTACRSESHGAASRSSLRRLRLSFWIRPCRQTSLTCRVCCCRSSLQPKRLPIMPSECSLACPVRWLTATRPSTRMRLGPRALCQVVLRLAVLKSWIATQACLVTRGGSTVRCKMTEQGGSPIRNLQSTQHQRTDL
ncbi:hypothetical protein BC831DRAFT_211998 [Entophlyctis helioformis]|nr:hypothetical protein BC831DRAFT_211998 [Entophlyctis helioformis]